MNCTCHPSEAPTRCQHQYAYSECLRSALIEQAVRNKLSRSAMVDILNTNNSDRFFRDCFFTICAEFRRLEAENGVVPLTLYDGTKLTAEHISSFTINIDGSAT